MGTKYGRFLRVQYVTGVVMCLVAAVHIVDTVLWVTSVTDNTLSSICIPPHPLSCAPLRSLFFCDPSSAQRRPRAATDASGGVERGGG